VNQPGRPNYRKAPTVRLPSISGTISQGQLRQIPHAFLQLDTLGRRKGDGDDCYAAAQVLVPNETANRSRLAHIGEVDALAELGAYYGQ
jgi:hypothetical protein